MLKKYTCLIVALFLVLSNVLLTYPCAHEVPYDAGQDESCETYTSNDSCSSIIESKAIFITTLYAEAVEQRSFADNFQSIVALQTSCKSEQTSVKNFAFGEISFPQFFQGNYPDVAYGDYGTVASHGCGITCLAMVATYLKNEWFTPDALAEQFGSYNTENGSQWILFEDSAEELGLELQERTYSWEKVREAIDNGQCVISLQRKGLFTSGGHYICLFGTTDEGKIIVFDPNSHNQLKNRELIDGFRNGFTDEQITEHGLVYWIYAPKRHQNVITEQPSN